MTDEDRTALAALRAIVTAAAVRGTRKARGGANKNPSYRAPSKAASAWTHVYGVARAFNEWTTKENMALAIKGLEEREDNQSANIREVAECAKVFTTLGELTAAAVNPASADIGRTEQ